MDKFITLTFLVAFAFIICSARVIDQVHPEDEAGTLIDAQLEDSFGSLAQLSDQSGQKLNRQKRDWVQMLALLTILQRSGAFGNGNYNNQATGSSNYNVGVGDSGNGNARANQNGNY